MVEWPREGAAGAAGLEVTRYVLAVYGVRDGKVVAWTCTNRGQALEAAGLSE